MTLGRRGRVLASGKLWVGLAASLSALAAAGWMVVARRSAASDNEARPQRQSEGARAVSTDVAGRVSAPVWIETTGSVRPELEASLAAKVMGRVVRLDVREGDAVVQGQPLVWLDSRDLRAAVQQAGAGASAARAGVSAALVAERMETSSSQARIAAAKALVAQAEASVSSARARLDLVRNGPRKQERAQAALAVAQAKADLELAEADHDRMSALLADGAVSRQQMDAARTRRDVARARHAAAVEARSMSDEGSRQEDVRSAEEGFRQSQAALDAARQGLRQAEAAALMAKVRAEEVRGARAQVSQANAALHMARTTEDYAVVRAPFAGVVARRLADPGAMATPGMPLLVVQGGSLRLEAVVPESALDAARRGARAEVRLDAVAHTTMDGVVVESAPQGDPTSHTFIARIRLPQTPIARAGMFGRARFVTRRESALAVASSAVWEREGLHYVFVVSPDRRAQVRLITVGRELAGRTTVLSGLSDGERVVVGDRAGLSDGEKVRF